MIEQKIDNTSLYIEQFKNCGVMTIFILFSYSLKGFCY